MKASGFFISIFTLFILVSFINCSSPKETNQGGEESKVEDHVEVIYFHGKIRCLTCMAIEKLAKETIDSLFDNEVKDGRVVFRQIDVHGNEAMADSYQTTGSSLFVTSFRKGEETRKDMTEFGFMTARKDYQLFQDSLASAIRRYLN